MEYTFLGVGPKTPLSKIKRSKSELTVSVFDTRGGTQEEKNRIIQAYIDEGHNIPDKALQELLLRLFPKLESMNYGYSFQATWRREGRICSPDLFDNYFKLAIPKNDFSVREINSVLASANDLTQLKAFYESIVDSGRAPRFLERLQDYTDEVPLEQAANILSAVFEYSDALPEGGAGMMFEHNNGVKVGRVMFQLLKRFPTQEERFTVLKSAIDNAPNALYYFADEVTTLGQQHGKRTDQGPQPEEERLVNEEHLSSLEQLALERIRNRESRGTLTIDWRLRQLLYEWESFGGIDEPRSFFNELVSDDERLLKVLDAFSSISYRHGMGGFGALPDHVATVRKTIDVATIERFGDLEEIAKRLREIAISQAFQDFYDSIKGVVAEFLRLVETGDWKKSFLERD